MSTDDFAGPLELQTNLALKGILGIKAMSGIAKVVDNLEDRNYYKVKIIDFSTVAFGTNKASRTFQTLTLISGKGSLYPETALMLSWHTIGTVHGPHCTTFLPTPSFASISKARPLPP